MARRRRESKGTFGDVRLKVAARYLRPRGRNRWWLIGLVAGAVILVLALADLRLRQGRVLSNGPLSSGHAAFEKDCATCHDPYRDVTAEKCSACHEKFGDRLGVFTFDSHYLYRSNDFRRLERSEKESPCFSCHLEHLGRHAAITRVGDRECRVCHEFDSFGRGHPEFRFAADEIPDAADLHFPHIHHVREVMKVGRLSDVERACLYCHNPRPDGKRFEPISFDRHCDACHLTAATATPRLPIAADGRIGVETLEAIRRRAEPGTEWALFYSSAEFREVAGRVMKLPVYHQDPWILHNLRRLRRSLYRDTGLADLLRATPEAPHYEIRELYEEAIRTLEGYALGLRSRPEPQIREELRAIEERLKELRRTLDDPYASLDETKFLLALEPRADVEPAAAEEIASLVSELTTPCRRCHELRDATIARVQKDQGVLRRAEFDHRAHIVQRRCLDCHTAIPIEEQLGSSEPVDEELDDARIQNLPRIDSCRECHRADQASDRCVTCHLFHPDQSRRSELLLYLDSVEGAEGSEG